jgi:hypothetical protein
VVGDVHRCGVGVELAVDGRGVREESKFGGDGLLVAGVVAEGTVGGLDEEVADLECLILEIGGLPYSETAWVAVPVVVWRRDVSHVVDLLAGVVMMDVHSLAVDGALEVVAAVLDTPEPVKTISTLSPQSTELNGLHVILVEAHSDLIALSVPSIVATRRICISTTGNLRQIEDLDDGTASLGISRGNVDVGIGSVGHD